MLLDRNRRRNENVTIDTLSILISSTRALDNPSTPNPTHAHKDDRISNTSCVIDDT